MPEQNPYESPHEATFTTTTDKRESADRRPRASSRAVISCLVAASSFLPLYVLSTGPMIWLTGRGYVPDFLFLIYWPLQLLAYLSTHVRDALQWYTDLWQ